jgi:nucleoside-diphosphate-sugar epimerase
MNHQLHVVLGANGVIGQSVSAELKKRALPTRLVERVKTIREQEFFPADLLQEEDAIRAISGASHVYICIGIPYSTEVWKKEWPTTMKNIITASEKAGATVIFLDNMYLYGPSPLANPIHENHLQNPESEKGKIRKTVADLLLQAHHDGRVKAVIGRSADFYGPGAKNSLLYITVLGKMLQGKNPQWLSSPEILHSFSYVGDNGRALVTLALDESSYGGVWHLPVSTPTPTVKEIVSKINLLLGKNFTVSVVPKFMIILLSLFIPALREAKEVLYQVEDDYVFSDAKFRNKYPDFTTTPYETGIHEMVEYFKKNP